MLTFVGAVRGEADRRRDPARAAARGPGLLRPQPGDSIDRAAARLRELVPEARIAIAHGQMGEHRLEQVIVDFWEKQFDVLVCTTIIETGLDISNANTLIVERADNFGLSQLHQLRGRVGPRPRARLRLLPLPAGEAADRDGARPARDHRQHTELGAGMQVAMKDLEIRGAGNLLGGEQSGHIAGRRLRPLRPAGRRGRRRLPRRGRREGPAEVKIELPVDAHLPHDYVPGERLRLEAYRKLADRRGRGGVWPRSRPSCWTATAPPPEPVQQPAGRRPAAAPTRARRRPHRHQRAGQLHPVRAGGAAREPRSCGSRGSTPAAWSRTRSVPFSCPGR